MQMVDYIAEQTLAEVASGKREEPISECKSVGQLMRYSKMANTPVHRSSDGILYMTYRGVDFIFQQYEFGVIAND